MDKIMELVKVNIIRTVITARYGALSPGDLLNTDLSFAKHLVDDCDAARFENGFVPEPVGVVGTKNRKKK